MAQGLALEMVKALGLHEILARKLGEETERQRRAEKDEAEIRAR